MAPAQVFPSEKLCMEWQQRRAAGAGLRNSGNTCFLNSVLQCLTYTPPLANYLLSREHSQSCHQQDCCVMCIMEAHVNKVLCSSGRDIMPANIIKVLPRIAPHFRRGMQEDAQEFFLYTLNAMQSSCLSASSDSLQPVTIVDQIFGGFLRSRVTCLSCQAVSDSYEAFLNLLLDIKDAASVTKALEDFVKPEQLDGDNCIKCSKCDQRVAASKECAVQQGPKVLTLCLKRFDDFTGRKVDTFVKYPEYLDLRPYMSERAGEPLLYSLYAVLLHTGNTCDEGHYTCFSKASNGVWYRMDDKNVDPRTIRTVLRQQAYLLFYVRCSDVKNGGMAASSPAPSHTSYHLRRSGITRKQNVSVGPEDLPPKTKDVTVDMQNSAEDSGSSRTATTRQQATAGLTSNKKEQRLSPSSHCQKKAARQRSRSRSPQWGNHLRSWPVDTTDYEDSAGRRRRRGTRPLQRYGAPGEDAVPGHSSASSQHAPTPKAAQAQSGPRQRKRLRSPGKHPDETPGCLTDTANYEPSARRRRTIAPRGNRTAIHAAASKGSTASSKLASAPRKGRRKRVGLTD